MEQQFSNPRIDQFMAITGCDGSEADYYLSQSHNNLENALHDFFEDPTKAHKNMKKTTLLKQYQEFKLQQEKKSCIVRSIDIRGKQLIEDVKILWKEIVPTIIRGTTPGEEFLMEIGGQMKGLHFQQGTFNEAIKLAFEVERPLLVLVYSEELKERLFDLIPQQVANYISDNFLTLGLLSTSQDLTSLKQQLNAKPSFNVFRINFINQVMLMSQLDIKTNTVSADILSFLKKSMDSIREEQLLESQIKRQTVQQQEVDTEHQIHNELIEPEESNQALADYESQKEIKRQQELELQIMIENHERKKSEQLVEIMQQKMQQQKLEQMLEDRKVRKLSLPDEPTLGEILTVSFRLPMGGRLLRSFQKTDKIQLIYNFIELEEKIEFENELDRKFDLLTMNPSRSLAEKRDLLISEVFGDETQEVFLVKQL